MDTKTGLSQNKPKRGFGFVGCVGIGCIGFFLVIAVIGIGGYFTLLHSSLPLRIVESAIEETGEVEIDGLEGSLSSGFSVEKFRFKTDVDQWSELNDINLSYESKKSSFFGADKIIIDDVSVKSGTIYAKWDPALQKIDLTPIISDALKNNKIKVQFNGNSSGGDFAIKNASINDLEIVNTTSDESLIIDDVTLQDFSIEDGKLESFGQLSATSSQVDIRTTESNHFADKDVSIALVGTLKAGIDSRLAQDFTFNVDFGTSNDLKDQDAVISLFDKAMVISSSSDGATVKYSDFALKSYLSDASANLAPSRINLKLKFDKHDEFIEEISDDGSVTLGNVEFTNFRLATPGDSNQLMGDATLDGKQVTFSFEVDSVYSPWAKLQLQSPDFESQEDLWAEVFFGTEFSELTSEQQELIANQIGGSVEPNDEEGIEEEEKVEDSSPQDEQIPDKVPS